MSVKYITGIPNRGAGIGHAFVDWAKAFTIAQKFNVKFLYSPFNGNNARWDSILGLGFGQQKLSQTPIDIQLRAQDIRLSEFLSISHDKSDYLYLIDGNEENPGIDWPESYDSLSRFLRSSYLRSRRIRPLHNPFHSNKLRVAVHIRRGNITQYSEFENRVLPIDYYASILKELSSICGPDMLDIIIVSNSEPGELASLVNGFGARYYDFNNDIQDLHTLTASDILVTSCSGFSYLAALINYKAIKVVPGEFWHSWPRDAYPASAIEKKECDLSSRLEQLIKLNRDCRVGMRKRRPIIDSKSNNILSTRDFRDFRLDNTALSSKLYRRQLHLDKDSHYIVRTKKYLGAFINAETCTVEFGPEQCAGFELLEKPSIFVDLSHLSLTGDDELTDICAFLKKYYNEAFMGRFFVIPHHSCLEARHFLNAGFHNSISCFETTAKLLYSPDLLVASFQSLNLSSHK